MRAGLIERGVPAEAIYRDPAGYPHLGFGAARARRLRPEADPDRLAALPSRPRAVPRPPGGHRGLGLRGARRRHALQRLHRTAPLSLGAARLLRHMDARTPRARERHRRSLSEFRRLKRRRLLRSHDAPLESHPPSYAIQPPCRAVRAPARPPACRRNGCRGSGAPARSCAAGHARCRRRNAASSPDCRAASSSVPS